MCKFKTGSKLKISWQRIKWIEGYAERGDPAYLIKGYGGINIGIKDVVKLAEIYCYSDHPDNAILIWESKIIADRE